MSKVKIKSAISSKAGVTLYLDDGQVLNLQNDSWKTQRILDVALPSLAQGKTVTIDLDDYSVEKTIEKNSGGIIRFFKKMVNKIVGGSQDDERQASTASLPPAPQEERMVAVVQTKKGPREIVGVERLTKHMEHAVINKNTAGFQKFMERLAGIKTEHTVDELLRFMERGDLPIADDGQIVAYKVLKTYNGAIVDCHTGKVKQKIGSRVRMKKALVDPSRRTQCSSGLHVARRKYLNGFRGDVITLIKIDPADVVAVPIGEPDKMRVAAYHIVAILPARVHSILRSNQPMTSDSEAAKILADVIAGNHVGVLETVTIGEDMGQGVRKREAAIKVEAPVAPMTSGEVKALDDSPLPAITPKEVRERAKQAIAEKPVKQARRAVPPAAPAKPDDKAAKIARALALVAEGKLSMRAIERETGIPARTIGRVLKNQ
ncbi:hypothetical protein NKH72_21935 [Mesorhizobium sp. M0955]|uniref:hypothetical protein n=1 Tax=Mesorhizobium sp. M0955 TaxID=2957033 RepID=UPI00333D96E9